MVIKAFFLGVASLVTALSTTAPAQTPMMEVAPTATPTIESPVMGEATLAFVGDVHFERHLQRHLRPGGMASLSRLWGDADLVMANLETAITSAGLKQEKIYNFRAPARAVGALQRAGVDVVSMANNHALDYGRSGLKDTLNAFAGRSIVAVGIGPDRVAALTPYRVEIPDQQGLADPTPVSIFAAATSEMLPGLKWAAGPNVGGIAVWEIHRFALLKAIRAEQDAGRVVVIYMHWGREKVKCPSDTQIRVASELEAAGASIVVGAHPHVLQGAGFSSNGTLLAYSLGNFIWYNSSGGPTGVLKVRLANAKVSDVEFLPARLSAAYATLGLPMPARDAATVFTSLARCANLTHP